VFGWGDLIARRPGLELLLAHAVAVCTRSSDPGDPVPFADAAPGHCWTEPSTDGQGYRLQDCAEPHGDEVFLVVDLSPIVGLDDRIVDDELDAACADGFRAYTGTDLMGSAFALTTVRPDPTPWIPGADQRGVCSLRSLTGRTTGSARRG
jgi:hypothetical protein